MYGPRTRVPDLPASREVDRGRRGPCSVTYVAQPVLLATCSSPEDGVGRPSSRSAGRAHAVCGRMCGTRVTLSGGLATCCHLSLPLGPGHVPAMDLSLPVCNREK